MGQPAALYPPPLDQNLPLAERIIDASHVQKVRESERGGGERAPPGLANNSNACRETRISDYQPMTRQVVGNGREGRAL